MDVALLLLQSLPPGSRFQSQATKEERYKHMSIQCSKWGLLQRLQKPTLLPLQLTEHSKAVFETMCSEWMKEIQAPLLYAYEPSITHCCLIEATDSIEEIDYAVSPNPSTSKLLLWCTPIGKLLFLLVYFTHPQVVGLKQWSHKDSPKEDSTLQHNWKEDMCISTPFSIIPLIEIITPFIHPQLPVTADYLDLKRIPYRIGDWFYIHSIPYSTHHKKNITLQQFHILLLLTIIHTIPDCTLPTIRYLRDYILNGDGYTCKHASGSFLWRWFRGLQHEPVNMLLDIISGCPPLEPIQSFQTPKTTKTTTSHWEQSTFATILYQLEKSQDYSTIEDIQAYWRRKRVIREQDQCCYLVNAGLVASACSNNKEHDDLFIRDVHFIGEDTPRMLICGLHKQSTLIIEQYIQHRLVLHSNQPASLLFLSLLFDYDNSAQSKIAQLFDIFHHQHQTNRQPPPPRLQLHL